MKRRLFLLGTAAWLSTNMLYLKRRYPSSSNKQSFLSYLNGQLSPATLAAQAASYTSHLSTQPSSKLTEGDIFWSVMWPYMYTVGRAEGTVGNSYGINPYQVIYTYDRFSDYSDHPRRAHPILNANGRPTGLVSDAAGWPQFISTTWDKTVANNPFWYDGPAFQPANQDLGFLYLHRDTGGHAALMRGVKVEPLSQRLTVSYKAFVAAIKADSTQWASLPGADIGKSTGQHTRPKWWLWTQFQWSLWEQMGYRRRVIHPIGVDKPLTSRMGYRASRGRTHWGQDFACPIGSLIFAPEAGVVTLTGYESKGGYYISFRPNTQPELEVIFRHCQAKSLISPYQQVAAGKAIGKTGNSGSSTSGPHAHIEVTVDGQHIDPHYYLGMSQWF